MPSARVRGRSGFTLVEVIATVAILAVLATLTVPTIRGRLQSGEADALVSELQTIQTAINAYKSDVGRYPNNLTYLSQLPAVSTVDTLDGCGNHVPHVMSQNYRGPYISRSVAIGTTNYVLPSGDTVLTAFGTVLTFANTIDVQIKGVDSAVATLVDVAINGKNNSGACGTCMLKWSSLGQTTILTYSIPFSSVFGTAGSC